MSAGRRSRRAAARWQWRRPDVELAADTRALVADIIRAHDNPDVDEAAFLPIVLRLNELDDLPEAERVEAALQVYDHATSALLGRRVRAVAVPIENRDPSGSTGTA